MTGWKDMDCGCCAGIEWGGEEPRECRDCNGSATLWVHLKTGTVAAYPGGPFIGSRLNAEEIAKLLAAAPTPPQEGR